MAQRDLPAHALLRAQEPACRVAEEDHADLVGRGICLGKRRRRRLGSERAQVRIQELAEPGHPGTSDHHLAHVLPPRVLARPRVSGREAERAAEGAGRALRLHRSVLAHREPRRSRR